MNSIAHSLSVVIQSQPRVYSLHDAEGRTVAFFASSEMGTIVRQIGEWGPNFDAGCVAICWMYGWPNYTLGRERRKA